MVFKTFSMKLRSFFILLLCNIFMIQAQTIGQAKSWFLNGEFKKALPVFQREIKSKPKNPSLNLWYGVCLLETGQARNSLTYLNFAKNNRIQSADFYLASYFLATGAPDSSLLHIDQYLTLKDLSTGKRAIAEHLRDSVRSCIDILQRVEDICFIDSVVVPKKEMYKTISLSREAGTLVQSESFFPGIYKNSGHAYFPERNDRVFYADTVSGKKLDLIARHRILNDWDDPESLPETINSPGNEINPFFMQDGMTLYFASDRPGGMGGYDIYVTRLNQSTNTYLLPDKLNMPFNSTSNDYFLIIDESEKRGYLATDRNSGKNMVTIYTFIPSTTKTLLKNKSLSELKDFAMIRSIRATWEGKNVDSLKQKSVSPVTVSISNSADLEFVFRINDQIRYSNASDFKSKEARTVFLQYKSLYNKMVNSKSLLERKRLQYPVLTGAKKEQTGSEILKLEEDLLGMQKDLPSLEITVRNLEIKALPK